MSRPDRCSNRTARIFKRFNYRATQGILSITINTIDRAQRFNPSKFVIRYSAVRFSARPPVTKAASLIVKKPCHFGVVFHTGLFGFFSSSSSCSSSKSEFYSGRGTSTRTTTRTNSVHCNPMRNFTKMTLDFM